MNIGPRGEIGFLQSPEPQPGARGEEEALEHSGCQLEAFDSIEEPDIGERRFLRGGLEEDDDGQPGGGSCKGGGGVGNVQ